MTSSPLVQLGNGVVGRVRQGEGDTILWIHGYTMDSSIWEELWALLPEWRHVGIDLPSHGASRPLEPNESLPALAHCLNELALGQGTRHLIALSLGTFIALQMAIEQPEAFSTLVLAAPALIGGPQERSTEQRYEALMRLFFKRGPGIHLANLWMQPPHDIFEGAAARPDLWARLTQVIHKHKWTELGKAGMYYLTCRPQTESDLVKIRSASLVLLGEFDLLAFKQSGQQICQWIPTCVQHTVAGTGHLCLLEAPHAASQLISSHLRAES